MPRLSAIEIEAVLAVAQNAEAYETFAGEDFDEGDGHAVKMVAAYERGIEKLRSMLASRTVRKR